MPLPKEVDPNRYKNIIRNLNGLDRPELNYYLTHGSLIYFDSLIFQAQVEKNQTAFTLTMLNTVYTGVFTNCILKFYDGITGSDNSKSRYFDDQEYVFIKPAGQ